MTRCLGAGVVLVVAFWNVGCSAPYVATRTVMLKPEWNDAIEVVKVRTPSGAMAVVVADSGEFGIHGKLSAWGSTRAQAERRLGQLKLCTSRGESARVFKVYVQHPKRIGSYSQADIQVRVPRPVAAVLSLDTTD